MSSGSIANIDLKALGHNLQQIRQLAPQKKIMAMIKSNAYGHGILPVASALQEADAFGVACLKEAALLRHNGINKQILLMRGFGDETELAMAADYNIDVVIHDNSQLQVLENIKLEKPIAVWMKIDTGMHRLGFSLGNADDIYQKLSTNRNIQQPISIMSHFAAADDAEHLLTAQQINLFQKITANFAGEKSIANSAGIINYPSAPGNWIRPGIMLYGVSPLPETTGFDYNLKPVMTLRSKIIAVKTIKKGGQVGYGATWKASEDMPVAIIAIGYGDGYPRHAKSGTPVLLDDTICPLIGRVSMDMIAVDLRNKTSAKCGDWAVLWGDGLPIEQIAEYANSIAYELLCGVTSRVEFKY